MTLLLSYKMTCIEVYSATLLADKEKKKIFTDNNKRNRID